MFKSSIFDSFFDPSISKFQINWLDKGESFDLLLPHGITVNIDSNNLENLWTEGYQTQTHTTRLWVHSLGWLVRLSQESNGELFTLRVLRSYRTYRCAEIGKGNCERDTFSSDHCAAVRLRVLGYLRDQTTGDEGKIECQDILEEIQRIDIELTEDDEFIKLDNHGMMLLVSLALVGYRNGNDSLTSKSLNRLKFLLESVIDKNGYVKENTVGYHDFYCKFLKNFLDKFGPFVTREKNGRSVDYLQGFTELEEILEKLIRTRSRLVWPCGGIPPIGDSSAYPTKYGSTPGLHIFKDSGFVVYKDDASYFSFIAGCGSEVHKQMDDLSFTMRLENQDFIVDSGLYNFDWEDPVRRYVASQKGHSGVFFKRYDGDLRPIFRRKVSAYAAGLKHMSEVRKYLSVEGEAQYGEGLHLKRRIIFEKENRKLSIIDTIQAPAEEEFVLRFVLPQGVEPKTDSHIIQIRYRDSIDLTIESVNLLNPNSSDIQIMQGFLSQTLNNYFKNFVVEISGKGRATLFTELSWTNSVSD